MTIRQSLLAIIDQAPCYGHQVRAEFERRTGGSWPLNVGQVYQTLDRLVRDKLVLQHEADGGRVTYSITHAGHAEVVGVAGRSGRTRRPRRARGQARARAHPAGRGCRDTHRRAACRHRSSARTSQRRRDELRAGVPHRGRPVARARGGTHVARPLRGSARDRAAVSGGDRGAAARAAREGPRDVTRAGSPERALTAAVQDGGVPILPTLRDSRLITIRRGGSLTDAHHRQLAEWAVVCTERVLLFVRARGAG